MARSGNNLLLVRQVAELAGVHERTVWRDIGTGRLASVLRGRRRLVPRSALRGYRCTGHDSNNLLTVPQVSYVMTFTERTVWNRIRRGWIPVTALNRQR